MDSPKVPKNETPPPNQEEKPRRRKEYYHEDFSGNLHWGYTQEEASGLAAQANQEMGSMRDN